MPAILNFLTCARKFRLAEIMGTGSEIGTGKLGNFEIFKLSNFETFKL